MKAKLIINPNAGNSLGLFYLPIIKRIFKDWELEIYKTKCKYDATKEAKKAVETAKNIEKTLGSISIVIANKKAKDLMRKACANIITQDWSHIERVAVETAEEALPSYGTPFASSRIIERKDRGNSYLAIEYYIKPVILAGTHPVRWEIDFICDPNQNAELCQGPDSNRYASDLKYSLPSSARTVPAGAAIQDEIYFEGEAQYWFNRIRFTLTYYVTSLEATVTETLYADIRHENEDALETLCKKEEDYIDRYELCKKIITAQSQAPSPSGPEEPDYA